jgi:hypothetical protein
VSIVTKESDGNVSTALIVGESGDDSLGSFVRTAAKVGDPVFLVGQGKIDTRLSSGCPRHRTSSSLNDVIHPTGPDVDSVSVSARRDDELPEPLWN